MKIKQKPETEQMSDVTIYLMCGCQDKCDQICKGPQQVCNQGLLCT